MRIIDADALDRAFTDLRFDGNGDLAHWGDRPDWCMHGDEVEKLIAAAPTIDAIPVEWLKEHDGVNIIDSDGNIYARRRITVVEALSMWQHEQEAQDG